MATTRVSAAMEALRKIAFFILPNYELEFKHKLIANAEKLEAPVEEVKALGTPRKIEYYWTSPTFVKSFDQIVKCHTKVDKEGVYSFLYTNYPDRKKKSLHSAICNRIRERMPLDENGKNRWYTRTDKALKTIHLVVK